MIKKHVKETLYRECLKKKRYKIKTAQKVVQKIFKERGIVLRIYRCRFCNKYHLTSLLLDKE